MCHIMRRAHLIVATLIALITVGCATTPMDKSQAQATSEAPVASQVEIASLPYDASLPKFVIAVEPFEYSASGQISGGGQAAPMATPMGGGSGTTTISPDGTISTTWGADADPDIGPGIARQFGTALFRWGNASTLEMESLTNNGDGTYSCKLLPGEVGPFVIKGMVTEFTETADASGKRRGGSLGGVGIVAGITGALTGNRGLTTAGGGLAAANPTMVNEEVNRTGMVGMDLRIVDGRTGRIVGGYRATGTFTTLSKVSGTSVFGIGGSSSEFAASALGQATRSAMNDALVQTAEALKTVAARE